MSNSYPVQLFKSDDFRFSYQFKTENDVYYICDFDDASSYFSMENELKAYHLSFESISETSIQDDKVRTSIKKLIRAFMIKNECPIIYICESLDEREAFRARLFRQWYNEESLDNEFFHEQKVLDYPDKTVYIGMIAFEWDKSKVSEYFKHLNTSIFE